MARMRFIQAKGFTLIELMVAMLIGLLVTAAAGGIYFANRQVYSTTETLGRIQENGRVAFELMARDIREAAGNPCGNDLDVVNVLRNRPGGPSQAPGEWWADFGRGIEGFSQGAMPGITTHAGSDAVRLVSGTTGVLTVETNPAGGSSSVFKVSPTPHGMSVGDIAVVCDNMSMSIFQVTSANQANNTLGANPGGSSVPGNCTHNLGPPQAAACGQSQGTSKDFTQGTIARLTAAEWYVADNTRGGRSLFRRELRNQGGTPSMTAGEEIIEGVENMRLRYLVRNTQNYVPAPAPASGFNWQNVIGVEIVLNLQAAEGAQRGRQIRGTDDEALRRQISHRVTLRNRQS